MSSKADSASRCVIVGGAPIADASALRVFLRPDDFFVFCDCGLRHASSLGVSPDLIVGDFDSYENPHAAVETIVLPREKDDTDAVFAAREAVRRGFREFLLLGVTGARLDHTLGNLSLLCLLEKSGAHGVIREEEAEIELVADRPVEIDDAVACFSLLAFGGTARGVTICGAKYPLENAEISCDYPYGVSNEVLPGKVARVTVRDGFLLLVRNFRA